ncbi:MAG: hemolysin III family protein [Desulfuromonadaceae bacterium]|nr:hemolysin III family protein [Desulfuromonadaceae bacterium]
MNGRSQAARYNFGEEIANSLTHGVGVLLSIGGLAVLVGFASLHGNAWHITSCSIFGSTLILLYAASTLYHSISLPEVKRVLRIIDHSAIYLLIAGTYTPFTLVNLRGPWGWSLFGAIWGLALVGIILKTTMLGKISGVSTIIYLIMGWVVVVATKPMFSAIDSGGLLLLLLGGLAYSSGIIFYAWKKLPYHHAIWHLFVMAGSLLHFFAILFYVIPR